MSLLPAYSVFSSAKHASLFSVMKCLFYMQVYFQFGNIVKRMRPDINPWGTPKRNIFKIFSELLIFSPFCLLVKYEYRNVNASINRPDAWRLETSTSFFLVSNTHGVKKVRIRSYSVRIFPGFSRIGTEYGEISEKILWKCGPE